MTGFALDPRLAGASTWIADLPLCQARLQDDARWPWILLVPRRSHLEELEHLGDRDRKQVIPELIAAGAAVRAVGSALGVRVERLNHGQLGLVVPQLHMHVVGRHAGDDAWPGPVWGHGSARRYTPEALRAAIAAAAEALVDLG